MFMFFKYVLSNKSWMIPGQHIWYIDIWISDFTIVIYHIWIIKSGQFLSCIKFATCGAPIVLMPAAGFGCCSQMWIANMRISPTFGNIWYCLVVLTILKNMSSSMGRIIPNSMGNKTCLKPPARICLYYMLGHGETLLLQTNPNVKSVSATNGQLGPPDGRW